MNKTKKVELKEEAGQRYQCGPGMDIMMHNHEPNCSFETFIDKQICANKDDPYCTNREHEHFSKKIFPDCPDCLMIEKELSQLGN